MKNVLFAILSLFLCLSLSFLTGCVSLSFGDGENNSEVPGGEPETPPLTDVEEPEVPNDLEENANTLSVTCTEGSDACWHFDGNRLTFSGIESDTVVQITGVFDGQILIDVGEYKFELALCGVTLYSKTANPIEIVSANKMTLTAKKDSENFIYDRREALSSEEETHAAAIFAACDFTLGGKGALTVISENNNGIHSKKDLSVKNLTLSVACLNNTLKGNDSVTITGGNLTLIAKTGDGIKTTNTDRSIKGNQRGTVSITGGDVSIYAACDGIDAAYDAEIGEDAVVTILTDRYSPYSEEVKHDEREGVRYIRFTSKSYSYSIQYYNSDNDAVWENPIFERSVTSGRTTYYYYAFDEKPEYASFRIFIYSAGQTQGQEQTYTAKSDFLTWNTSYDTFALESRGGSLGYSWINHSFTSTGMGGPGGMGGMMDGNTEKGDHSTKGIKAGNEILVSGGILTVKSYDDALHANAETALENGETPTGNVIVSGGTLELYSNDDGIHADGVLTILGGDIKITNSYEGLEGTRVVISGGNVSVISRDDGINATATSGTGITVSGGSLYVYAGGDGLDANSRTAYAGIVFRGGTVTVVSTSQNNSSLDTEQGYTYEGGMVLAVCPSGGMSSEAAKCQNFASVATKTTLSLKAGQTLTAKVAGDAVLSLEVPTSLSALVIFLGSPSASLFAN